MIRPGTSVAITALVGGRASESKGRLVDDSRVGVRDLLAVVPRLVRAVPESVSFCASGPRRTESRQCREVRNVMGRGSIVARVRPI